MKSAVHLDAHTVADIEFQPASLDIWDAKYRLAAKDGAKIDATIDDTYKRVAKALASVELESKQEQFFEEFLWALRSGAIPAGRIMSNAGALEHKPATSTINCTVSGTVGDSMDNILNKVHEAGLTLKAGCGIGYEFSTLRPKGAYVTGAGAYTSGPLSFMDIYDKMCFTVSSAGGRRGAQMGTFDIGHPDVMEFIRAKREDGRLRQFNLSLLVTDEFMQAVINEDDWKLAFPVTQKEVEQDELDIEDDSQFVWRDWPEAGNYVSNAQGLVACKIYKTLPARRVWDIIMASTYDFAEPGFVLIDKVNEMNNNWFCENIRATNPCGEQPLPPYGSCLLGSINLTRFVVDAFSDEARFDWESFRKVVKVFTRMLDNVVEINGLPLPQQRNEIQRKRRHGMGFLGLGSTITMLRMKYGEAKAVQFTEDVARELALAGWEENADQATGDACRRLPGWRQGTWPHTARAIQPLHATSRRRGAGAGRIAGGGRCSLYTPQLDCADGNDFAVTCQQCVEWHRAELRAPLFPQCHSPGQEDKGKGRRILIRVAGLPRTDGQGGDAGRCRG
jgi:ribonucleoside-diphosphate reductase alpha chain